VRTHPRPKWLGNFYGSNIGFLNYEVLTIQHIPRKDLKDETALMTSKWFDYRRLHPMQASYYFVHCYTQAFRNFYRKAINVEAAPFVRCVKEHDFLEAREKLTLWRLRQLCDRIGIRYDFFLNYTLDRHYRMVAAGGKVYPPRPAHILNNESLIADAALAWEEWLSTSLQFAKDPFYRVSNFSDDRRQLDHEAFVVKQIKARRLKHFSIHAAMYVHDVMRIERAMLEFSAEDVNAAISEVNVSQE
jgi:hypothetical protein